MKQRDRKNHHRAGGIGRSHEAIVCPKFVAAGFTGKTGCKPIAFVL
ncbi:MULTISPECIES: hypothetical protein [unclassified Microcoleus]|nr:MULTISPECIES: hypothetical protein [unclassified Microcoleus]MCC3520510.1 hypothetical protein [Microcoleus sp. PH2017_20_SFW_D_A]MCC3592087.1 hypothetical protein [Microcoleus sp. PH2017_28_MFU_U_A]MCC3609262.1 hypothetical protein [Microcoleus sp. PH2017_40_RAT_O_B]